MTQAPSPRLTFRRDGLSGVLTFELETILRAIRDGEGFPWDLLGTYVSSATARSSPASRSLPRS